MNKSWMILGLMVLLLQFTLAIEYHLTPMNYPLDQSRNLTITVSSPGDTINVTFPTDFVLVSGTPDGIGSVNFVLASPNISLNGDISYFNVSINGSYYDHLIAIAVPDQQIVDNKWEIGHGDFNYPSCTYIPNETVFLFPIIRFWGVGSDVLNEPALNITFTCNYPSVRPRTVDSKFTTDYSDPSYLKATGFLEEWEGASIFRVFVLSQEINLPAGSNYEVTCTELTYQFQHETVIAQIPPINLTSVSTNPFTVVTSTTSDYVQYLIVNNGQYEVRDLEFIWQYNDLINREELASLSPGEAVKYKIWVNGNPTIDFNIRSKPCWMFDSRSPTYYDIFRTDTFSVNTNTTQVFTIEEKIFYKPDPTLSLQDQMDELLFLFKINQEEYHMTASILPEAQQNEANFTCYRLGLQSNGFNTKPEIRLLTNATISEEVIVKNNLFQTMQFGFTQDTDGYGVVSWQTDLGQCSEDLADNNYVCPTTYNYICLAPGLYFQKLQQTEKQTEVPKASCFFCREKMIEVGSYLSPTYPAIGFLVLLLIIFGGIYAYYYYEDDLSLKRWITDRRQKKEQEKYYKWQQDEMKRQGGAL